MNPKYPKDPVLALVVRVHWGVTTPCMPDPGRFVDEPMVVTEKLDGANTLLHAGEVYGRSVSAPCEGKWMAMVKKHHAWKVRGAGPVSLRRGYLRGPQHRLRPRAGEPDPSNAFCDEGAETAHSLPFRKSRAYAKRKGIPVVPVLFKGRFRSLAEIRAFLERAHSGKPSLLGGEREGVVLYGLCRRLSGGGISRNASARASARATCRAKNTGPGTGSRAKSHGDPG